MQQEVKSAKPAEPASTEIEMGFLCSVPVTCYIAWILLEEQKCTID